MYDDKQHACKQIARSVEQAADTGKFLCSMYIFICSMYMCVFLFTAHLPSATCISL